MSSKPLTMEMPQMSRGGIAGLRVSNAYTPNAINPDKRAAARGQKKALRVARWRVRKYRPKKKPESRGRRNSRRLKRQFVMSVWEMSQTAAKANVNPIRVGVGGTPMVNNPKITGISAANKAETGAAIVI